MIPGSIATMTEYTSARSADLPQMVELLGMLFEQEAEFSPDTQKQKAGIEAIFSNPALGRFYVAREGKQVVAMASLLFTVSTAEGGKAAWFEDLVVHPEHRKHGIGAKLLEHVIAQARTEGVLRITLLTDMQNERAQVLYRRLGFVGSPMKPMRLKLKK
jgi:GNAT superfamily N-acetyltransferase